MKSTHKTPFELADILRTGVSGYVNRFGSLTEKQRKVVSNICKCRTAYAGGNEYTCCACGDTVISYNACRDRHCPKCQGLARAQWVKKRIDELLPVGYFHVVFTIPHELNPFVLRNKKQMYDILFHCVAQTLLVLGKDPKHLGAIIGVILVLHTWGQNLLDHPHVHCIVAGGGIRLDGKKWVFANKKFLFPIPVMTALFRGKFMDAFKNAIAEGKIEFHGQLEKYTTDNKLLKGFIDTLYKKNWVVFAKNPFACAEHVVKYLGQYTHRIAFSNNRIKSLDEENVTFHYKDYADDGKSKTMTLSPQEFTRRFFLHILPHGFTRIRYIGLFSNANKMLRLERCFKLLNTRMKKTIKCSGVADLFLHLMAIDITQCRHCQSGHYEHTRPLAREPHWGVT